MAEAEEGDIVVCRAGEKTSESEGGNSASVPHDSIQAAIFPCEMKMPASISASAASKSMRDCKSLAVKCEIGMVGIAALRYLPMDIVERNQAKLGD